MKLSEKIDCLLADAEELLWARGDVLRLRAERRKRWGQVIDRWNELVYKAALLMSEEDRGCVNQVIEQANESTGPLDDWLDDLADGNCRLPELTAETMRDLLLAWLSPERDTVSYHPVCTRCGLEYPKSKQSGTMEMMQPPIGQGKPQNPELFTKCPNCGSPAHGDGMMWSHRINERDYEWMQLDGYVGKPIQDAAAQSGSE